MAVAQGFVSDLRVVLRSRGFRRLFSVRLVSQAGDGVQQVALASLFFFSPERQSSAGGVAAAFAVLLLPFTIVGPWVGPLLDRWSRRQVLVVANLVRAVGVLVVASLLVAQGPGLPLYVTVLFCLSLNRFLLAALAASLPHVVPRDELVMANAVSPTAGGAAAFLGGAAAFAVRPLLGSGDAGDARLLVVAAGVFAAAGLLALRLGRGALGPDAAPGQEHGDARRPARDATRDLVAGLVHVRERRGAALALAAIGAHRLAYGVSFISTILLARNRLTADAAEALALLGVVVGATGVGFVLAAWVTPVAVRRVGQAAWIAVAFTAAAVTEAVFVVTLTVPLLVAGAFVLGLAAQTAKICVDTIIQLAVDDTFRGRVFVLYDVVFNAAFVSAAALAVLVVPDDGYSRLLYAGIALWYLAAALAYRRATRRSPAGETATSPAPPPVRARPER